MYLQKVSRLWTDLLIELVDNKEEGCKYERREADSIYNELFCT